MKEISIGDTVEHASNDPTIRRNASRRSSATKTVAVLGYGVQGRGQSLNMHDNGVKVIVGQRPNSKGWDLGRQEDGWVPGKTLFDLEEAAKHGTVIQYLLSDAGQKDYWPKLKPLLTPARRCTSRTASPSSSATRPASSRRRTST